MGSFKRFRFWRRTRNDAVTTVKEQSSMGQNLRSDASTQAETKTRNGGAQTECVEKIEEDLTRHKYALTEYEERIRKLEEQLAMSQATTIEVLCNVEKLEQNLREYAERPITNWSEDCECRPEVAEIANGLKETIKKHRQADNLQIGGLSSAPSCKRLSHAVPSATSSPRHVTSCDVEIQTTFESHSRQSNGAGGRDQKTSKVEKLESEHKELSRLVEKYKWNIRCLKEDMGLMEKDYLSEIRHLKRQLADVQEGPFSKNRDLRHKLERQRAAAESKTQ